MTSRRYKALQRRLDDSPQGAPESEALFRILETIFTEDEAEQVSILPMNFFTVDDAARIWGVSAKEGEARLDALADKGILLDFQKGDTRAFILAPTMAGFFEFTLMRTDGRFDRKVLSELFEQYVGREKGFTNSVLSIEPAIGRVFVQEGAVQAKDEVHVLDYERARKVIDRASSIAVGTCYCRHKKEHAGEVCDNPQDVCLSFNFGADTIIRHGIGKRISKKTAHRILDRCIARGLVQLGDNVQENVNWMCNCCGCCCEALNAYRRLGHNPNIRTNYVSNFDPGKCMKCGTCRKRCPVGAMDPEKGVDQDRCIGCGVCVNACKNGALQLDRRSKRQFVPKDSFERFVLEAVDAGKLQNFIFDNYTLWTHALLRRLVWVILALPPTKRLFALRQVRSRFMAALVKTEHYVIFRKLHGASDYSHPEMA